MSSVLHSVFVQREVTVAGALGLGNNHAHREVPRFGRALMSHAKEDALALRALPTEYWRLTWGTNPLSGSMSHLLVRL